eukprot:303803-Pelagomonas_calceolata.AAC.1
MACTPYASGSHDITASTTEGKIIDWIYKMTSAISDHVLTTLRLTAMRDPLQSCIPGTLSMMPVRLSLA